jgi:transcriptional regulator with GAF, ATPase, and Fis domain
VFEPALDAPVPTGPERDALRRLLLLARADLAATVRAEDDPERMIGNVLELVVSLVPGAEFASVSGVDDGAIERLGTTDPVASACDRAQEVAGQGPAFDVLTELDGTVHCADLAGDTRWPEFVPQALESGVRSVLACVLPITRSVHGVLSVYASKPDAFDEVAGLVLPVFAARASIALAYSDKLRNLRRAIDTRQLIGQACGILMERRRWTADQAFAELVTVSQRHHLKLRDIALRTVESGQDPAAAAGDGR